jgi:hypothetical protein
MQLVTVPDPSWVPAVVVKSCNGPATGALSEADFQSLHPPCSFGSLSGGWCGSVVCTQEGPPGYRDRYNGASIAKTARKVLPVWMTSLQAPTRTSACTCYAHTAAEY